MITGIGAILMCLHLIFDEGVTQSSYVQGIVVLICVLKATYRRTVYRYLGHSPPATDAAVTCSS